MKTLQGNGALLICAFVGVTGFALESSYASGPDEVVASGVKYGIVHSEAAAPAVVPMSTLAKTPFTARLVASDGTASSEFGESVSLWGDTALIGNGSGAQVGYVFVRNGSAWSQQTKLVPSVLSPASSTNVVALDADTAVIGVPSENVGSNGGQGAAYVFVRSGSNWSQQARLVAADGAANDAFGAPVRISGNTIVVGARGVDIGSVRGRGAIYVFVRNGSSWTQQARLTSPTNREEYQLGLSLAISGETVVGGEAYGAHVFVRSGQNWGLQQTFGVFPSLPYHSWSTALSGNTAVFGDFACCPESGNDSGRVRIYSRSGSLWSLTTTLNIGGPSGLGVNFGESVAISGDIVSVGAPGAFPAGQSSNVGAVFTYVRTSSGWVPREVLSPAGESGARQFGKAIAMSGTRSLVGSPYDSVGPNQRQGAAYIFDLADPSPPSGAQAIASEIGACQSAPPGGIFAQPLGIIARTASGSPASGVPIAFSVAQFNGASATLSATSVTTDTLGRARVTATASGTAGGPYAVTARLPDGASTTFKLVNLVSGGPRPVCDAVPLTGLAPTATQPMTFSFRVDVGTPNLRVVTSGGTGNANLRVQLAQALNTDSKLRNGKSTLCESTGPGNEEECTIANPTPGSWTAVVSSPSSASNVSACFKCGPIPPPELVRLEKGQPLLLLPSTGTNESRRFYVLVPEGARDVVVRTAGGSGNADLLTRFGEPPVGLRVDCTRAGPGNDEACDLGNGNGTLYIEVRGAPSFVGLTLTASWTEPGAAPILTTEHDLNKDGFGDLLWRNDSSGRSYAQLRTPSGVLNEGDLFVSSQWRVTHAADINGDGRADTLWYNTQTAESYYWVSDVSGLRPAAQGTLLRDPVWRITHTGDFDGDRIDDLLWYRNDTGETHVWLMQVDADGRPFAPSGFRRTLLTSREWNVVATGDIDGDGIHDLIWYNAVTGESYYWHMGGLLPQRQGSLLTDRNWFVVAAGDLNGDGRSELLWYNPILRNNYYWVMNQAGTGPASQGTLLIHPEWRITGTTDVDGDRRDDLLWRNDATGESFLWYMNGPVPVRQQSLLVNPAWRVINR